MKLSGILLAVALSLGLTVPAVITAGAANATSLSVTTETNYAFGGYSAHPNNASSYVVNSQGSWKVPGVKCSGPITDSPRVAVWDGIWGSIPSMQSNTGWLPQIGTYSNCNGNSASYGFIWEMESQVKGDGNAAQLGPSGTISPGNNITASVAFLGPYGSAPAVRTFELWVTDTSNGHELHGDITTGVKVGLMNIARQGGIEIEGDPGSGCIDLFGFLGGPCVVPLTGGLADYSTPIKVTAMYTDANSAATGGWAYIRWVYKWKGTELETTPTAPSIVYNDPASTEAGFTETWYHQT